MRRIALLFTALLIVGLGGLTSSTFSATQQPGLPSPPAPPPPSAPMPAALKDYKDVTDERLKNPDAGDWLMVRRTWDGWGYSPLDEVTPANVARLQPACLRA
jgi:hypothetical protein